MGSNSAISGDAFGRSPRPSTMAAPSTGASRGNEPEDDGVAGHRPSSASRASRAATSFVGAT
jgi:hypothetical protein